MSHSHASPRVALLATLAALALGADSPPPSDASPLRMAGMTFVGSKGSASQLVVRSAHAWFHPDDDVADLQDVRANATNAAKGLSFEMSCDRAQLNVETNDFAAEGNVRGVTGEGQHYSAPWVRYLHEEAVLYTDAPVLMVDSTGSFRGDGFRYYVNEKRFQLLGNVRVVQTP